MSPEPESLVACRLAGRVFLWAFAACLGLLPSMPARAENGPAANNGVTAASADSFLSSLGVNMHVDQGYDPASYVEPLRYTGIRNIRDGIHNGAADLMIHQKTGARFDIIADGDIHLDIFLDAATTLAKADALLAVEGPNEPNNFPIIYQGVRSGGRQSWAAIAKVQSDLYARMSSDPVLHGFPVFAPSETGAEYDNVGLQFLTVPAGSDTKTPAGTRFADYANVHNYVIGNGSHYDDNQAWNAADPVLNGRWDGLYGNNGVTWYGHYRGYDAGQLETLPRVTTETGWDTSADPGGQEVQGCVLVNTYLAQFKRGWRYTFIYEMRDGEGSPGAQGLYHADQPKLSATYIHNLTTILSDHAPLPKPGRLAYAIPDKPETVHDLLLQKSNGTFELAVWDERVRGTDAVNVDLGRRYRTVNVYDVTKGTKPVSVFTQVRRIALTLSNHAVIIEPRT